MPLSEVESKDFSRTNKGIGALCGVELTVDPITPSPNPKFRLLRSRHQQLMSALVEPRTCVFYLFL
jgi:hypothetical protein